MHRLPLHLETSHLGDNGLEQYLKLIGGLHHIPWESEENTTRTV